MRPDQQRSVTREEEKSDRRRRKPYEYRMTDREIRIEMSNTRFGTVERGDVTIGAQRPHHSWRLLTVSGFNIFWLFSFSFVIRCSRDGHRRSRLTSVRTAPSSTEPLGRDRSSFPSVPSCSADATRLCHSSRLSGLINSSGSVRFVTRWWPHTRARAYFTLYTSYFTLRVQCWWRGVYRNGTYFNVITKNFNKNGFKINIRVLYT